MGIVLSLIALAIAFAGGLGIAVLLGRPAAFNRVQLCGVAVILGAGLVSASSFLLGRLLDGTALRTAVTALCIGCLLLAVRRDRVVFTGVWPVRFHPAAAATAMLAAAALCLITWISLFHSDLAWDGLFNWEAKSRVAFLNHGVFPLQAFASNLSHSRYPLLIPLMGAWMYGWLGRIDQSMLQLVGPFFYLGALLLLAGSARRITGSHWAALLTAPLLVAVPPVMMGGGSASTGYADLPIAVIYLASLVAAMEYESTGSKEAARQAGVLLMLGVWTKADMIVLLVCIAAVVAPRVIKEKNWKAALVILFPGLAARFLWSVLLVLTTATPDGDFSLKPHLTHLPIILRYAVIEVTKWPQWSLLWPMLALAAVLFAVRRRGRRRDILLWGSGIFLPMAVYPCVFIFSRWDPVNDHIASSLSRLYLQVVPAAILFIAVTVHEVFETNHPNPPPRRRNRNASPPAADRSCPRGSPKTGHRGSLQNRPTINR